MPCVQSGFLCCKTKSDMCASDNPLYIKMFCNLRFIIVMLQFQFTIATNCQALTRCMKVSYVEGQEGASSLLFQCIVSILRVLIVFWCVYVRCSILCRISQEERAVFWEVIASVILSKNVYIYMCPIPNGSRVRAISLYSFKIVDKKEILRTVQWQVGAVYLVLWRVAGYSGTPTCRVSGYPRQVIKVETLLRRLRFIWTALPTVITLNNYTTRHL
jgi:hypothetical protein